MILGRFSKNPESDVQGTKSSQIYRDIEEGQDWLTIYSDLMTLLLVFFVLLYIFSVTGQLPLLTEALTTFQDETGEKYKLYEDQSSFPSTNSEIIFSLPSNVLFDLGKAEIRSEAIPYLEKAVKEIKQNLISAPEMQIRIEGYTDNIPIHNWRYSSNWELSAARAISVVRYFIEVHQFPPMQLQAMGYGEYNPVAQNDTPENRRKNRRVEIKLVRPPETNSVTNYQNNKVIDTGIDTNSSTEVIQ